MMDNEFLHTLQVDKERERLLGEIDKILDESQLLVDKVNAELQPLLDELNTFIDSGSSAEEVKRRAEKLAEFVKSSRSRRSKFRREKKKKV